MPPRLAGIFSRRTCGAARPILLLSLAVIALLAFLWSLFLSLGAHAASHENAQDIPPWSIIGKQGDGPGQFQQPRGITTLPDGSFVVVDRAARVQHLSADGKALGGWSMKEHQKGNPKGLCWMPNGDLLVCDTHYGQVLQMSMDGQIVKVWGSAGRGPAEFIHPLSCAVDFKKQRAYIVEYGDGNDRVQKFTLEGKFVKSWGTFGGEPGNFQRPSGVCVDAESNVYVADAVNHRIQKFDDEGKLLKIFGKMGREPGELRYPYDVACGSDGLIYVVEFNNHRVSVFDREGAFVRAFGGPGNKDCEFANPWSLTADLNGRLLVSDTGNYRIQIFDTARTAGLKLTKTIVNEVNNE